MHVLPAPAVHFLLPLTCTQILLCVHHWSAGAAFPGTLGALLHALFFCLIWSFSACILHAMLPACASLPSSGSGPSLLATLGAVFCCLPFFTTFYVGFSVLILFLCLPLLCWDTTQILLLYLLVRYSPVCLFIVCCFLLVEEPFLFYEYHWKADIQWYYWKWYCSHYCLYVDTLIRWYWWYSSVWSSYWLLMIQGVTITEGDDGR